ncbi:hypothetical protein B0J12DRAFT_790213 [Macrophomina phaseolina]|uniref:Uncharacterized protein n=1 Tax=Macrophomina phaseolina TaxID=35725 RepID=A0ABQ8FTH9_9PEZI|nr:hypothetical protein B0J12DRAFT_790213 [Macrophomina phaseolina]
MQSHQWGEDSPFSGHAFTRPPYKPVNLVSNVSTNFSINTASDHQTLTPPLTITRYIEDMGKRDRSSSDGMELRACQQSITTTAERATVSEPPSKRRKLAHLRLSQEDFAKDGGHLANPSRKFEKEKKADVAAKSANRSFFRWADLPSELKNLVYALALTSDEPVRISSHDLKERTGVDGLDALDTHLNRHQNDRKEHANFRIHRACEAADMPAHRPLIPNLLLANRQTLEQGRPLLYGNDLLFETLAAFYTFACRLDNQPSLRAVKNVTIPHKLGGLLRSSDLAFRVFRKNGVRLHSYTVGDTDGQCSGEAVAEFFYHDVVCKHGGCFGASEEERLEAVDRVIKLSHAAAWDVLTDWMSDDVLSDGEVVRRHAEAEKMFRAKVKELVRAKCCRDGPCVCL